MIIYPDVIYSTTEYEQEVAAQLDDPFGLAFVDVFWHGTRQYQCFIERDGVAKHQDYLRRAREGVEQWQDMKRSCETGCSKFEARTLEHRRGLFKNTGQGHGDRVGKQMDITVAMAVESFRHVEANNAVSIKKLRQQAKLAHGQIQSYKWMVERLTAALVMYRHEHLESLSDEAKPPDVFNHGNTATADLRANLPAPEIKVKPPNGRTATIAGVHRVLAASAR